MGGGTPGAPRVKRRYNVRSNSLLLRNLHDRYPVRGDSYDRYAQSPEASISWNINIPPCSASPNMFSWCARLGPSSWPSSNNIFPPQPLRSVLDLLLTVGARTCQHGSIYYLYYRCTLAPGSPGACKDSDLGYTKTWSTRWLII